jgi:hypothetical protein
MTAHHRLGRRRRHAQTAPRLLPRRLRSTRRRPRQDPRRPRLPGRRPRGPCRRNDRTRRGHPDPRTPRARPRTHPRRCGTAALARRMATSGNRQSSDLAPSDESGPGEHQQVGGASAAGPWNRSIRSAQFHTHDMYMNYAPA